MGETKITVRYGCDSCGDYFENMDSLNVVEVKFLRSDVGLSRSNIVFDSRKELACNSCFKERDHGTKAPAGLVAPR